MSFDALVVCVLVSSPSDAGDAREVIAHAMRVWNSDRSRDSRVVLLPLMWEIDSVAQLTGSGAQETVTEQLMEDVDIVMGAFNSRLGTPTSSSLSGTAEEILTGLERGLPVHVYFSGMPLGRDVELEQYQALGQFRDSLQGLIRAYSDLNDLFVQVRSALERDVAAILKERKGESDKPLPSSSAGSDLRARISRGLSGTPHSRECWIDVKNVGSHEAQGIRVLIVAASTGDAPRHSRTTLEEDLRPGGETSIQVFPTITTADSWRVLLSWQEAGVVHNAEFLLRPEEHGNHL